MQYLGYPLQRNVLMWDYVTCSPVPTEPQAEFEEGVTYETSKGVQPVKSFDDMSLKPDLLRGVYQYGFEKPSAIQQRAIGPILGTRDVIAQAQSGTGKTSMIALALCQKVDNRQFKYESFQTTAAWLILRRSVPWTRVD